METNLKFNSQICTTRSQSERLPICFGKKGRVRIRVSHIHPTHDGRSGYNHYDSLIDCIEWLVTEGYFNKEYLEG